jgi:hypothetical protein
MDIFLKAKHWQLFLLNFAIPFVAYIAVTYVMIGEFIRLGSVELEIVFKYLPVLVIIGFLSGLIQYAWTWTAGIRLMQYIPEEFKLNTLAFKIFFFLPLIYFPIIAVLIVLLVRSHGTPPTALLLLLPIHLFMVFCSFYCMYFAARVIKTAEYQQQTRVNDYIAEIIMIWFFPIGIWFIQPKINKLIENTRED